MNKEAGLQRGKNWLATNRLTTATQRRARTSAGEGPGQALCPHHQEMSDDLAAVHFLGQAPVADACLRQVLLARPSLVVGRGGRCRRARSSSTRCNTCSSGRADPGGRGGCRDRRCVVGCPATCGATGPVEDGELPGGALEGADGLEDGVVAGSLVVVHVWWDGEGFRWRVEGEGLAYIDRRSVQESVRAIALVNEKRKKQRARTHLRRRT